MPMTLVADMKDPPSERMQFQQLVQYALETESAEVVEKLLALVSLGHRSGTWRWDYPEICDIVRDAFRGASPRVAQHLVSLATHHDDGVIRVAAVDALVGTENECVVRGLAPLLQDRSPQVRSRVAGALEAIGRGESVSALAMMLRLETDVDAIHAAASALMAIMGNDAAPHRESVDLAVSAVCGALGRVGLSNASVTLRMVEFLARYRRRDGVLALVGLLERVESMRPTDAVATRRIRDLRAATEEALRGITGAVVRGGSESWRSWWESCPKDYVPTPTKTEPICGSGEETVAGRNTRRGAEFFDVPVSGRQVLFMLDASGSMAESALRWPDRRGAPPTLFDVARREFARAVGGLAADTLFGVVVFSSKPRAWRPELVAATTENRDEAIEFVRRFPSSGTTGVWKALEAALSVTAGESAEVNPVDELIIVSDGRVPDPESAGRELYQRVQRLGIKLSFVAVGKGTEGSLLRSLAEKTGGRFTTFLHGGK